MKSEASSVLEMAVKPRKNARSKTTNSFAFNETLPKFRAFMRGLG